jgi:hypothetical protein
LNACERLIVPPERTLKRLAALRLVFILGIAYSYFGMATGGPCGALANLGTTCFESVIPLR